MSHINEITPEKLEEMLDNNQDIHVIDVRENEEVAQGMIPTATHIPLGHVPEAAPDLDKDKEYVMVCRSGKRSMNAATYLKENGFNNVNNLAGGMLDWSGEKEF
ncbi:rhodanese-like domain-containing protein [Thalassobacillus sp. CUG 92003]|uniref:rhodanese-like domain-containing protein n=1 Tax=Thalassobacillus sp. CUG 92003 TaxID=2736641 RepID=UPI0015E6DBB4|nr:rhodanese-like domain-containing protein [Thalassobacillus sp. CUG 92003]